MTQETYVGKHRRNPERAKAAVARYQASDKGRATIAAYNRSEARKASLKKYWLSEKGKATKQRYAGTEKQRSARRRGELTIKAKLARALRDRVRKVIKRGKGARAGSAVRDLGCSIEQFKLYISSKFEEGMSWSNYGEWHLDHILPLARFDLSLRAQFLQAVHYTNYQPLWAEDNRRKAAKLLEAA